VTGSEQDDVARYVAAVRAALTDLSEAARADLVDDLEDHLREVLAETGGSPVERFGPPDRYAAAARHPAGQAVLAFLPSLRPGWWVLWGYRYLSIQLLASVLSGLRLNPQGYPFPPRTRGASPYATATRPSSRRPEDRLRARAAGACIRATRAADTSGGMPAARGDPARQAGDVAALPQRDPNQHESDRLVSHDAATACRCGALALTLASLYDYARRAAVAEAVATA